MNRPFRQVFLVYLGGVLFFCVYVPWQALPDIPAVSAAWLTYDFIWHSPQTFGYRHEIATGRLICELASLTAIFLCAAWKLAPEEKEDGPGGER